MFLTTTVDTEPAWCRVLMIPGPEMLLGWSLALSVQNLTGRLYTGHASKAFYKTIFWAGFS